MKKTLSLFAIALTALALIPTTASAKDMNGRFGIGGDTTLAGVNGVSARFQIVKNFGIQAVASFSQDSATQTNGDNDVDVTNRQIAVAIRGDIGIAFTKETNLSIVFGINIINAINEVDAEGDDADVDADATVFPFEFGLKAEHFFTNFFSVHVETGARFVFYNEDAAVLGFPLAAGEEVDGFLIDFGVSDTFGSAGFTFWFN